MDKKITVQKLGEDTLVEKKPMPKSILKKTSKLKLKGVRDPASSKKHTIRILTSKGHRKRDKTLKKKIGGLSDKTVTQMNKEAGLIKNTDMPPHLQREVLKHAVSAGFVSI
jgi:hypothetical protein